MIIIGCSKGKHLAQKIAKKLKGTYSNLEVKKFPDGEISVRFINNVSGKVVVLVQSFYGNINDCVVEVIFAAETAKDFGAKKVFLVAPYFPYLRQDKRFKPGQAISNKITAGVISRYFDKVYIIDPHLHRETELSHLFSIQAERLTSNPYIADYIKKNIKNPLIVGPDWESYKWARNVAEMLGVASRILKKKRYSSYHVEIRLNKKIDLKGKNVVIVDDIISTGNTIQETAKILKRLGAGKIYCICVHGIFADNALSKLKRAKISVVSTNTIPSKVAKIDVSGVIAGNLK